MKSANASLADLRETRAVQVLEKAIAANRLAQAILLHGESISVLESVAHMLAAEILGIPPDSTDRHPDIFTLRTRGKARQITIGSESERSGGEWPPNSMRRFIHDLNLSPQAGSRKIGIVVEADRMNNNTANAFLKTLEEPPANTTLFLLTIRPYDLLDTIRSRCLNFRLPASLEKIDNPDWITWLHDYGAWIEKVSQAPTSKGDIAQVTLSIYGLICRFEQVLQTLTDQSWEDIKANLPENLSDDAVAAVQTGVMKSIRQQLFGDIERATRHAAIQNDGQTVSPRRLARTIAELEHAHVMMDRLNLNEATALETFLIASLRIWPGR